MTSRKHASSRGGSELFHVVVDTNVFISLLPDRNEEQRVLAKELLLRVLRNGMERKTVTEAQVVYVNLGKNRKAKAISMR